MPTKPSHSQYTAAVATVSVAEAKATLSSLLTKVERKRNPVTILRRGVPVAQLVPFPQSPRPQLAGSMAGTGRELGDIVSPLGVEWTVSKDDWTDDGAA